MASGKLFSNESRRFHDEFNGGGSWGARTAGDGDAEFLSHAFTHFVAFQSVDFATRHHHHHYDGREMSACVTAVGDECDELDVLEDTAMAEEYPNELDCKQISLWSYFSGILDDLTCDITFIQ
ncbi:hypothetical protein LPJ64_005080 [Coemansia asiatica]|uniref:Uncharacterized protein n=1 Tax=Coemansia asiatica TaxID=1052880 RepID=A0A9W7XGQ2_9FUNG|nr:hypothetical protein LPJ64_005080 [Coemansia asiatica]